MSMHYTNVELKEKLLQAQELLSDIYHWAGCVGELELEGLMSCADSCIGEAVDHLKEAGE